MKNIEQKNVKLTFDLREWWEEVKDSNEAQARILRWEEWPFYWYDESREWICTLQNGMLTPIDLSKTKVMLPNRSKKASKNIQKRVLDTLKKKYKIKLNINNRVKDSAAAYNRVKAWEKEVFWFVSEDKSTIRVLDFTQSEKPSMFDLPIKETKITYYTTKL